MTGILAVAGLLSGIAGLFLSWRQRTAQRRDAACLRNDIHSGLRECQRQMKDLTTELDASELNAQLRPELLRDGRIGAPARSRALGLLRSGVSPDTAAVELGLAKTEVRLLAKIGAVLAPRS